MAKVDETRQPRAESGRISYVARRAILALIGAGLACVTHPAYAAGTGAGPPLYVTQRGDAKVYILGVGGGGSVDTSWYTPAIRSALLSSRELWEETPQTSAGPPPFDPAEFQKLTVRANGSLFDGMSKAETDRLIQTAQPLGITREQLAPMRTWFVAARLSMALQGKAQGPAGPSIPPEMFLVKVAQEANIPIRSEMATFGDYPRFMAGLSETAQRQYLFQMLDMSKLDTASMARMDLEWARGDQHAFEQLMRDMRGRYPQAYAEADIRRNIAWVGRIRAMLAEGGSHFIAVGVGHTLGPDSIQAQLRNRGMAVHRVTGPGGA